MKRINKVLFITLIICMLLLTACGDGNKDSDSKDKKEDNAKVIELDELISAADMVAAENEYAVAGTTYVIDVKDDIATLSVENDKDEKVFSNWLEVLKIERDTRLQIENAGSTKISGVIQGNGSVVWDTGNF